MVKEHVKKKHPENFREIDFSSVKRGRISKDKLVREEMNLSQNNVLTDIPK